MKILVTVGTTQFNELIKYIDLNIKDHKIIFQIATGNYIPSNHKYFTFSENFNLYINSCNIVITHSGAGSVYSLLEMGKKIIVVPNLERIDKHQKELASYVEKNNYAYVAWELEQINSLIDSIETKEFEVYKKDPFNKVSEINNIINQLYFNN